MNVNMYLTAMLGIKMATVKKKITHTHTVIFMLAFFKSWNLRNLTNKHQYIKGETFFTFFLFYIVTLVLGAAPLSWQFSLGSCRKKNHLKIPAFSSQLRFSREEASHWVECLAAIDRASRPRSEDFPQELCP